MGQKTHPNGLRVGLYRKWSTSWYGSRHAVVFADSSQNNFSFMTQGSIASRGGNYFSNIEVFAENLFKRYSITKVTQAVSFLFVDFRFYKGLGGHIYGFLLYTKQLSRR